MGSQRKFALARHFGMLVGLGLVFLLISNLHAQQMKPMNTEVMHIGTAETKRVVNTGYFPGLQPGVYWHDQDWDIDLVIPPGKHDPFSLSIRSGGGKRVYCEAPR